MILLIDNYDSFTYNLFQYVSELGKEVKVVRNDAITLDEIAELNPEAIILSPGPGAPAEAGICVETVQRFAGDIPILGICLGHQAIGEAFGGNIIHASVIKHGKTSLIEHKGEGIYQGLENPLEVMRYHSLVVDKTKVPSELEVTSISSEDDEIMGLKHQVHQIIGLQFHPESIGTAVGKTMLKNFFTMIEKGAVV